MILYHFTARALLPKIRREGLTKGMIPWGETRDGRVICKTGFQWLTRTQQWSDQTWALRGSMPISKNSIRITVLVPKEWEGKVAAWTAIIRRYNPPFAEEMNQGMDYRNWVLFSGRIPPRWFLAIDQNPGETIRPDIPMIG
jgi:hypothetical protein